MTDRTITTSPGEIDVIRQECLTARVSTALPLALIEELYGRRGRVPRSTYLAQVIDAAMMHKAPHLPDVADSADLIESLAERRYRQHVRSIELSRQVGGS
jgi:hypothetical protein